MAEHDTLTHAQGRAWRTLTQKWGGARSFKALPAAVVYRKTKDTEAVGWRTELPADYLGIARTLDIIVPRDFPLDAPQCWVEPNPHLEWPHGETNGKLCLWPPDRKCVDLAPEAWVDAMIERLGRLFELVVAGSDAASRDDAFAEEWTSYWSNPTEPTARTSAQILLVTPPSPEPTLLSVRTAITDEFLRNNRSIRQKALVVCGDDDDFLSSWLRRLRCPTQEQGDSLALCVPLRAAPTTPGAPSNVEECRSFVKQWARDPGDAIKLLERLLSASTEAARWILFTDCGAAMAGLRLTPSFWSTRLTGRQSAKTRAQARSQRRQTGFRVAVAKAERADPAWIQEREQDPRHAVLQQSRILVVGVGSLGSMVLEGLALSGIGSLMLVDPGTLETTNVGRHALGIAAVDQNKATAMRSRLECDYPHLNIRAFDRSIQEMSEFLSGESFDLVVCTSADPVCEAWLIERLGSDISSLLLSWSEPHALAGHSVHADCRPRALKNLFNDGRCVTPATAWPEAPAVPLPGCGASHLPGAGNRIRLISSLVAEHAIAVLAKEGGANEHRTWVAASDAILALGGRRLRPDSAGESIQLAEPVVSLDDE